MADEDMKRGVIKPTRLNKSQIMRRYRARLKGDPVPPTDPYPQMMRNCAVCGKEFRTYPSRIKSRYCSYACANEAKKGVPLPKRAKVSIRTCETCGNQFEHWARASRRFCSNKCGYEAVRSKIVRSCSFCGIEFRPTTRRSTAKFCSRACTGASLRRNEGTGPVGRVGYRGAQWPALAQSIRERDDLSCRNCGTTWSGGKRFPVDHIRPWRLFDKIEDANDPSNLVTLCHSCHSRKTFGIERRALAGDQTGLMAWKAALGADR